MFLWWNWKKTVSSADKILLNGKFNEESKEKLKNYYWDSAPLQRIVHEWFIEFYCVNDVEGTREVLLKRWYCVG